MQIICLYLIIASISTKLVHWVEWIYFKVNPKVYSIFNKYILTTLVSLKLYDIIDYLLEQNCKFAVSGYDELSYPIKIFNKSINYDIPYFDSKYSEICFKPVIATNYYNIFHIATIQNNLDIIIYSHSRGFLWEKDEASTPETIYPRNGFGNQFIETENNVYLLCQIAAFFIIISKY